MISGELTTERKGKIENIVESSSKATNTARISSRAKLTFCFFVRRSKVFFINSD